MRIEFAGGYVRPWLPGDVPALTRLADSRAVWRNLRDAFPNPYSKKDARTWIRAVTRQFPCQHFAIIVEEGPAVLAGGIGVIPGSDVHAGTAEIGYWLGEAYWGRGIMTAALSAFTEFAWAEFRLRRLYAHVLEWNPASMRVLEKCDYVAEGRLRKSAWKDGAVADEILYARVV